MILWLFRKTNRTFTTKLYPLLNNNNIFIYIYNHFNSIPEISSLVKNCVFLSEMEKYNYKLPLRAANKAITNGPDATIKARTISCAITSKFIMIQLFLFYNSNKFCLKSYSDNELKSIQYWRVYYIINKWKIARIEIKSYWLIILSIYIFSISK